MCHSLCLVCVVMEPKLPFCSPVLRFSQGGIFVLRNVQACIVVVLLFPGDKYAKTNEYAYTCLCVRVGGCEEYSIKLLFLYIHFC